MRSCSGQCSVVPADIPGACARADCIVGKYIPTASWNSSTACNRKLVSPGRMSRILHGPSPPGKESLHPATITRCGIWSRTWGQFATPPRAAWLWAARIEGSAEAIPLDRYSIESVVTTWTLCSMPRVSLALREVRRLLPPQGLAAVCRTRPCAGGYR